MAETKRDRFEKLYAAMDAEYKGFEPHFKSLAEHFCPRRPRWTVDDVNKGDRRSSKILDTSTVLAVRTFRSGLMSGLTNPARPWVRLTTPDPQLAEYGPVKEYLYFVTNTMAGKFIGSNLYKNFPADYQDNGVFGTSALHVEEDLDDVLRTQVLPIGSYRISQNERGVVDCVARRFTMTVRNIVKRFVKRSRSGGFDWSNCSDHVKSQWAAGNYETRVNVTAIILPNEEYDENGLSAKYKRYLSAMYETGNDDNVFLSESGYDYFPTLVSRWDVTGEDSWATDCPGMTALGDAKMLQHGAGKGLRAFDKMVEPPLKGAAALKKTTINTLPNGVTYLDLQSQQQSLEPLYEVEVDFNAIEAKQAEVRRRVNEAFYKDLFLMFAQSDRRQITAREIVEKEAEKIQAVGPVLQQIENDKLNPLVDCAYDFLQRQELIPPAPPEIQGMKLRVEYTSIMAQAMKLAGLGAVKEFFVFCRGLAEVDPQVLDKVNRDQLVDVAAEMLGVPPTVVVGDEQVAAMRQARAKLQAQQMAAEQIPAGAKAAKDLAAADMTKDSMLRRLAEAAAAGQLVNEGA